VQTLAGRPVTIAQWGYDPFTSNVAYPAPIKAVDDTGFQVIFARSADVNAPGKHPNLPSLTVTSSSNGVSGFVGETAKGGRADNHGSTVITTGNHAPRVTAPPNRTLPIRTPFSLKGHGSDRDGDRLTYLWEQNDIGARDTSTTEGGTSLVDNVKPNGPLFRVFGVYAHVTDEGTLESPSPGENHATHSGRRTFPDMVQILSGQTNAKTGKCPKVPPLDLDNYKPVKPGVRNCYSEFLPRRGYVGTAGSSTPAMHFRITARDGYPNGGGTAHDDVRLRIDPDAGPFLVSSLAVDGKTLHGGGQRTIRWEVNGTQRLAAKVRILLSTDGGRTWKHVLATATANDGAKTVAVPEVRTNRARIMIQAVGNYFFDTNDADFTIR
jgi:hypothetical protein